MNRRQKLVQAQFLNNEQAVIGRLEQVYGVALTDIDGKIEVLMKRFDPDTGDLPQSVIYQLKYQEMLKTQVEDALKTLHTKQFLTVSDYLDTCYEDGFIGSMFDLQGQGVPMVMPINPESMVQAVQLDSKISEGLYTRLGEDVGLLKKKITAQVSRSIATGISYEQTAKALAGYTRVGYNNAIRIARTEGHRIQCRAADDVAHAAKDRGADIVKQWDATLDGATRESHIAVDGEIKELDEKFSNGLEYPGDPAGGAAEVVNCRCAYLQRARWALGGSSTKWNGFTDQLETFDSPEAYDEFKTGFFSPENRQYMNYVEDLQNKYGTKDFKKILDQMTDQEYKHYSKLLANNPVYNKGGKAPVKYKPDYDCAMAKKFGNTHYDATHDMVVKCTNSKAADVWKEYESQIGVGDAHQTGGAFARGGNVYLDIDKCAKGDSISTAYQTVFHEGGHALDTIARKNIPGGHWGARHYSSAYKDGIFPETIKAEVADLVKAKDKELKALWKAHDGDWEWLRDNGLITKGEYAFHERFGIWSGGKEPKYSKSIAYAAITKEVKASGSALAWGDLSDILEGATGAKIQCGVGHGADYWKKRTYDCVSDGLATEAFAEMMDSTFANPESLALIQKYLPKSYNIFEEMLESML
jgi:hypothetical protein